MLRRHRFASGLPFTLLGGILKGDGCREKKGKEHDGM
jgi:hypothetical protein